jgi:hypothetical protein
LLYFFPSMESLADSSFVGLSYLGWVGFTAMWVQVLSYYSLSRSLERSGQLKLVTAL